MKEQLQQRLTELKKEFETGEKMLADIDAQRNELYQKLLRISGAIQVLEEEMAREPGDFTEKNIITGKDNVTKINDVIGNVDIK